MKKKLIILIDLLLVLAMFVGTVAEGSFGDATGNAYADPGESVTVSSDLSFDDLYQAVEKEEGDGEPTEIRGYHISMWKSDKPVYSEEYRTILSWNINMYLEYQVPEREITENDYTYTDSGYRYGNVNGKLPSGVTLSVALSEEDMKAVPSLEEGKIRTYYVLAQHEDGSSDVYPATYNDGILTFTCDRFSVFTMACRDREPSVERIFGRLRYDTSIAAADELKKALGVSQFDVVVLATGEEFADALGGGYLAAKKGGPILLTKLTQTAKVNEYIQKNLKKGGTVYVLGGDAAVSEECLEGLEDFTVKRLSGRNRYLTNLAILEEAGVTDEDILICTGEGFADSLSASATGRPMLLVKGKGTSINDKQEAFLKEHADNDFYIIGGEGAVSKEIETSVSGISEVTRVKGKGRQETSAEIARTFFKEPKTVVLANSQNYPDGLCAGPLAYVLGGPILLVTEGKEAAAQQYVEDNGISTGYITGGNSAVKDETAGTVFPFIEDPEEPADELRVLLLINGTLGDKSFFDSAKEGLDMINRDFGDQVYAVCQEMTYDDRTWASQTKKCAAEGWDIIIAGTYDMLQYVGEAAKEYPDTKFWFYDEKWNFSDSTGYQYFDTPNVYAVQFAQNEGSFLAGAAAAMASSKGKVAYMGGMDNMVLEDFFVGYANGAKYADPEVSVNLAWANSFNDPSQGKSVTTSLYNEGNDVVFVAAGSAGLGGFDTVVQQPEGSYIIGVDGDQGAYFSSIGETAKAERTLTSVQKNVGAVIYNSMKRHLNGAIPYGTNEKLGVAQGAISLSESDVLKSVLTAEELAKLDEIKAGLISGSIDPGTAFGHDYEWFQAFAESVK
ncbi:MAG: BMP family ABC transporter substrate-binding protein [Erysipelotrichaceae bacterium]|nr:BMP family ABC transporter substrate-binding protein [Erysipelotrichaceae bacterium]